MRKFYILFVAVFFVLAFNNAAAQCPGCIIDNTCTNADPANPLPNICPSSLPHGELLQPYDEDLTIWIPKSFTYSGTSITIERINVTGVSGLHPGLALETNLGAPPVTFNVPGDMRVCAKICGTPTAPGTRSVLINVIVTVSTPVGTVDQAQSFPLELTVDVPSGGNAGYSFNPAVACDSAVVDFDALLTNDPYPMEYRWDFGSDGSIDYTGKTPPPQSYVGEGVYSTTLSTYYKNFMITEVRVNDLNSATWYWHEFVGDGTGVTILGIPLYTQVSDADLSFSMSDGVNSYNGAEVTDNDAPVWTGAWLYDPNAGVISISFTENDPIGGNENGGIAIVSISGAGDYPFSTIGGDGVVSGNIHIEEFVEDSLIVTDTVYVYASPLAPMIETQVDSLCDGDSTEIVLHGVDTSILEIVWFKDSNVIIDEVDTFLRVGDGGFYYAKVINRVSGCEASSQGLTIYKFSTPATPTIIRISDGRLANSNYPGTSFELQWYLNGEPLPGENNIYLNSYGDGVYTLYTYNANRPSCGKFSSSITITALNELSAENYQMNVFPNPAKDEVSISYTWPSSEHITVILRDVMGRIVYQSDINNQIGNGQIAVNLDKITKGIYLLEMRSMENSITKKLIINK